jgi:hypothetical protein
MIELKENQEMKGLENKTSDVVYGTGVANFKAMMEALKRQGLGGAMSIEYEHGDLAHLDTAVAQCVATLDKIAAGIAEE